MSTTIIALNLIKPNQLEIWADFKIQGITNEKKSHHSTVLANDASNNESDFVEKDPELDIKPKVITTNDAIVISRGNEKVNESVGKKWHYFQGYYVQVMYYLCLTILFSNILILLTVILDQKISTTDTVKDKNGDIDSKSSTKECRISSNVFMLYYWILMFLLCFATPVLVTSSLNVFIYSAVKNTTYEVKSNSYIQKNVIYLINI